MCHLKECCAQAGLARPLPAFPRIPTAVYLASPWSPCTGRICSDGLAPFQMGSPLEARTKCSSGLGPTQGRGTFNKGCMWLSTSHLWVRREVSWPQGRTYYLLFSGSPLNPSSAPTPNTRGLWPHLPLQSQGHLLILPRPSLARGAGPRWIRCCLYSQGTYTRRRASGMNELRVEWYIEEGKERERAGEREILQGIIRNLPRTCPGATPAAMLHGPGDSEGALGRLSCPLIPGLPPSPRLFCRCFRPS